MHTIDGELYELNMELTTGLGLYEQDSYEAITGEPAPDEEPAVKATPLFYEVTGENGEKLYLLGTIHVGDARTGYLPQVIYDALDEADALAVEFDMDTFYDGVEDNEELQQLIAEAYYYTDGTTIANHIDSDIYRYAVPLMKVAGQYSTTAENLKAYVWSSIIENFYLLQGRRLSASKGVDERLMRLAREKDKEILNVESGEFQIRLMSDYSDEVQEMLLAESVFYSRSDYLESLYELYELWCAGDEQALSAQFTAMSEEERAALDEDELKIYDEYTRKMELERNEAMVEVAEGYLNGGSTVFYAVGLAHLLGEGGLVQALTDAGYTVTLLDTHG